MSEEFYPATESRDPATRDLDTLGTTELVERLIDTNDRSVAAAREAAPAIARAVETIVTAIEGGGRVHYIGAGTSGRLGVLDAAELPPTFGTSPDLVVASIAGGETALRFAVEGAEDDAGAGESTVEEAVSPGDVAIGISASGGAAFVVAAIACARLRGCGTIAITSVAESPLALAADDAIVLDSGPEPIAGSTRMRAGTAQKIVLATISTAVMVRLNKVYDNYMVDLVATNAKLRGRAERLVRTIAGVDAERARALLWEASGSVKTAVVMACGETTAEDACERLARARGSLRAVLDQIGATSASRVPSGRNPSPS